MIENIILGSNLRQDVKTTRIKIFSIFAITTLFMILINSLSVYLTSRENISNFRLRGEGMINRMNMENFRLIEEQFKHEQINRLLTSIIFNNLSLLIALLSTFWILSYFVFIQLSNKINAKDDFLRFTSHELRTPLAILNSELSLVKNSDNINDLKETVNSSIDEVKKLHNLSNYFLEELEGKTILVDVEYSLKALIEEIVFKYKNYNPKSINIITDLDEVKYNKVPKITMERILTNLIDNIIKYSKTYSKANIILNHNQIKFINFTDNLTITDGTGIELIKNLSHKYNLKFNSKLNNNIYNTLIIL
jgi:signal transduction histidine kinase